MAAAFLYDRLPDRFPMVSYHVVVWSDMIGPSVFQSVIISMDSHGEIRGCGRKVRLKYPHLKYNIVFRRTVS